MNAQEVRLECLRLAAEKTPAEHHSIIVEAARAFLKFATETDSPVTWYSRVPTETG